jgi:hypothetical protein
MKVLFTVLMTMFFTVGCSVLDKIEESPMTAQLVTNQLTLRFIAGADDPIERATKLREKLADIETKLPGEYTLLELDSVVRAEIDWQKYSLADQELLNFALTKARNVILDLVGEGLINPEDKVTIDTLFRWIDQAAQRVQ